ncbi:reverse transcriptase-like protein [Halobacillus halophilus]|uniref:reverse transcriptase-like protein n=1 Tax=Halobacillus halophilus TaxID=1570 RepID=UPI001CD3520B|nr:reverse transcriptase-like protein [Halobacillus halophilus]MCA1009571.1 reverse transcriptase-like protein [Halobacillus halophilus]
MDVRMIMVYQVPKGTEAEFTSEVLHASQGIQIAEDMLKTKRAKSIAFLDSYNTEWTLKELKEYMKGIQTEPHNVKVYFDGGFDLGTKNSGLGFAIYYDQNGKSFRLRKNVLVHELDTNNEAEYAALHNALLELDILGVHHLPVKLIGDSQVVINQLIGEWPCLEEPLSKWADRIDEKLIQLGIQPQYHLISRKDNREADRLASQALNNIEIISTSEVN